METEHKHGWTKVERLIGLGGLILCILGLIMLWGGQVEAPPEITQKEIDQAPTIQDEMGQEWFDLSEPYEKYIYLLRKWNRSPLPRISDKMHFTVDLRDVPDEARNNIREAEKQLDKFDLLFYSGNKSSSDVYEVTLYSKNELVTLNTNSVTKYRSGIWRKMADLALLPMMLGFVLGTTTLVLRNKRIKG